MCGAMGTQYKKRGNHTPPVEAMADARAEHLIKILPTQTLKKTLAQKRLILMYC